MTMSVSLRHVLSQGPVLAALARTAVSALGHKKPGGPLPAAPGPWFEIEAAPRPEDLVRDYIRHVGGDVGSYRKTVPAHMFPQWAFALTGKTLAGLPYPLIRAMNGGCRLEMRAPLPANEPLQIRARLESIDDNGKRAILTQRVITGTKSAPDAVVADMRVFIPLPAPVEPEPAEAAPGNGNGNGKTAAPRKRGKKKKGNGASKKPASADKRPSVPADAREIAWQRLRPDAGLDFAKLTGDFNPIHWIPAAAHASGFRSVILHGFSTLARTIEALNRRVYAGDVSRLGSIDARFTRPVVLPATLGIYVQDHHVYVGDAPGGGAYLEATYADRT
jgi:acyl dehydratase